MFVRLINWPTYVKSPCNVVAIASTLFQHPPCTINNDNQLDVVSFCACIMLCIVIIILFFEEKNVLMILIDNSIEYLFHVGLYAVCYFV